MTQARVIPFRAASACALAIPQRPFEPPPWGPFIAAGTGVRYLTADESIKQRRGKVTARFVRLYDESTGWSGMPVAELRECEFASMEEARGAARAWAHLHGLEYRDTCPACGAKLGRRHSGPSKICGLEWALVVRRDGVSWRRWLFRPPGGHYELMLLAPDDVEGIYRLRGVEECPEGYGPMPVYEEVTGCERLVAERRLVEASP